MSAPMTLARLRRINDVVGRYLVGDGELRVVIHVDEVLAALIEARTVLVEYGRADALLIDALMRGEVTGALKDQQRKAFATLEALAQRYVSEEAGS